MSFVVILTVSGNAAARVYLLARACPCQIVAPFPFIARPPETALAGQGRVSPRSPSSGLAFARARCRRPGNDGEGCDNLAGTCARQKINPGGRVAADS